jgi:predicted ATP-grasp superfamily ATP-dependent carboligase
VKRIVYARADLRIDRQRLDEAVGPFRDQGIPLELCDLPADQSVVRRGEPILSLLGELGPAAVKNDRSVLPRLRSLARAISQGLAT